VSKLTVIICGMDNTGKTTLIEQLKEKFPEDLEVIKPPGPWPSKEVMMNWLEPSLQSIRDAKSQDKVFLFDRYPLISEPIYGPEIRGVSLLTPEEESEGLEVLMNAPQQVILIFCRPPREAILNFGEREQMEGVIERSNSLIDRYEESLKSLCNRIYFFTSPPKSPNSSLILYLYDWTADGPEWVFSLVKNHIDQVREGKQ